MKRLMAALWAVLALLALGGAAAEARVMVVSDLHYLAPELYRDSPLFLRALRAGDGKLTQEGETLMDALRLEVRAVAPDALIVTGDLSFNGERASHEALARRFADIEADGVPVWVIPGNHDINSPTPRAFEGEGWRYVEAVDEAAFREIYASFMNPPEGEGSLSYHVALEGELWLAMTDVAFYRDAAQTFGLFTAGHAEWLEGVLRDAAAAGTTAVTATHHSLLAHTEFARDSYLMFGSEAMAALNRRYGAALNLSGHLHVQHIARAEGLTDAALGAFCVWPHRYALVTLADDGLRYEARSLEAGLLPEGFLDGSRAWFEAVARDKALAALAGAALSEADIAAMADYATRFNLAYFSGLYDSDDPSWRKDPAYALWQGQTDNTFWGYMKLVMDEPNGNNLKAVVPEQ